MSSISDEVAADFKDALQDLKVNSRPEISNLTLIAKENTEHAQAISTVLENHIRTVSEHEFMSCGPPDSGHRLHHASLPVRYCSD
jgi:hypothetical protein